MIRKANPNDINQLLELENACFNYDIISRRSFQTLLKKPSAEILIAEIDNHIIGSIVILFRKNSNTARIYSISVLDQYRQQGIAAALLQYATQIITTRGSQTIILEVRVDNSAAIAFYKKHGYESFGTYPHFYEDGTDALRMRKEFL